MVFFIALGVSITIQQYSLLNSECANFEQKYLHYVHINVLYVWRLSVNNVIQLKKLYLRTRNMMSS